MKLLRSFPPLNARQIVVFSLMNVRKIPEEIYRELVAHPLTL